MRRTESARFAAGPRSTAPLPTLALDGGLPRGLPARPVTTRHAYFEEVGAYELTLIYLRSTLVAGQEIVGPAIVEQPDTTTVVYPGQTLRVHPSGVMTIDL